MTGEPTLPHLEACLELFRAAYDQHGTKPFTPDQLEWEHPELTVTRLLEFGVAYGLLSSDGTTYSPNCGPSASDDRWETVLDENATRTKRAVLDHFDDIDRASASDGSTAGLRYDGEEFASVFVDRSDDFAAVADTVATVDLDDWAGVVLRAPGDYANEVQRFADRLGDRTDLADLPISTRLQKISSDVAGTEKDALEFRLYLRAV